jgi:hypothetical protein
MAGLGLATLTARLCAETAHPSDGIKPVTLESLDEAIRCGQSGAGCAITPYRLCPSEGRSHSAFIATPFSRIASSVFEALKRNDRPRPMTPGAANGWGVGIFVFPSANYDGADSIRQVIIKRGSEFIQPETTTLAPVTLVSPTGETKQLSKGFFAFAMDAFAPTTDIVIVFSGSGGDATCRLTQAQLSKLR